jgi:hypothetical protein
MTPREVDELDPDTYGAFVDYMEREARDLARRR